MILLDGRKVSEDIKAEVRQAVARIVESGKRPPCLAVVLVGDDPASAIYVKNKNKACQFAGITSVIHRLPATTAQSELSSLIGELNGDGGVDGILVQLPLPEHIDESAIIKAINPAKDADCFHPYNAGLAFAGLGGFLPCTPAGIIELLKRSGVEIAGKRAVVVGRSNIVGKPAALLLLRENATVTICHSRTNDLKAVCREADIVVVAVGKPKMFGADYFKDGAVIVDVGMHRTGEGFCGDVDFDAAAVKAGYITPVPGGVGPMTIAMLMKNCLEGYNAANG